MPAICEVDVVGSTEIDVELELVVEVLVGVGIEREDMLDIVLDDLVVVVGDNVNEMVVSSAGSGGQLGVDIVVVVSLGKVEGVKVIGGSAGSPDTIL